MKSEYTTIIVVIQIHGVNSHPYHYLYPLPLTSCPLPLNLTSLIIILWSSIDHKLLSNQFPYILHKQTLPLEKYDHQCWEEIAKKA